MFEIYGSSFVPSALLSNKAGAAIVDDVKANNIPLVVVSKNSAPFSLITGGTISYFSSGGLSSDLSIKPDIGAIGGLVYSTISPYAMTSSGLSTPYAVYSGTSMSSPYLAGCVALLIQGKKLANQLLATTGSRSDKYISRRSIGEKLSAALEEVQKLGKKVSKQPTAAPTKKPRRPTVATTATPTTPRSLAPITKTPTLQPSVNAGSPGVDFYTIRAYLQNAARPSLIYDSSLTDSVANQGAGLVNVYNAIISKTLVTPSLIELNDTQYFKKRIDITIYNQYSTADLSSIVAATANPFTAGDDSIQSQSGTTYTSNAASVSFHLRDGVDTTQSLVTIPAGGSLAVKLKFYPPATSKANSKLLSIYSGFITITPIGSASSYPAVSVPYAGMLGQWNKAAVWSRDSPSFTEQFGSIASTGIYNATDFSPVDSFGKVSGIEGAILSVVASTSSPFATVLIVSLSDYSSYIVYSSAWLDTTSYSFVSHPTSLVYSPLSRMTPITRQSISTPDFWLWKGQAVVFDTNEVIQLPKGQYLMSFVAEKQFANPTSNSDSVNVMINLVY